MRLNTIGHAIDHARRRFLGTTAMTLAAAPFIMAGSATAQSGNANVPAIKPGTHTSFGALKQIDAGVLNIGYAEAGPQKRSRGRRRPHNDNKGAAKHP